MYYKYSDYLKDRFETKIYKLPVNLSITCPNRTYGTGCSFCADFETGFEAYRNAAATYPDIVENSISTRPDCIQDEYLQFLKQLSDENKIAITSELGLQTVNYSNGSALRRGGYLHEQ